MGGAKFLWEGGVGGGWAFGETGDVVDAFSSGSWYSESSFMGTADILWILGM